MYLQELSCSISIILIYISSIAFSTTGPYLQTNMGLLRLDCYSPSALRNVSVETCKDMVADVVNVKASPMFLGNDRL